MKKGKKPRLDDSDYAPSEDVSDDESGRTESGTDPYVSPTKTKKKSPKGKATVKKEKKEKKKGKKKKKATLREQQIERMDEMAMEDGPAGDFCHLWSGNNANYMKLVMRGGTKLDVKRV